MRRRQSPKPSSKIKQQNARPAPATWWIYVALFVITFAIYFQVRTFEFVDYDDPDYVPSNPHVRQGLTLETLHWAFTSTEAANWLPVTRLSHILDFQLFRLDAGMHHLDSVLIHAFATLLLFAFLHRATRSRWPSAFVAAIFALHPLHVESVAWIAERKDILAAFFWFLALWIYVLYAERPGPLRYLLVVGAFCLGLLSKPMIVTLPFVLLLLDYWPLRRSNARQLVIEKIPFFLLTAAAATATYLVQQSSRAVKPLEAFPVGLRLENAFLSYFTYLEKTVWPTGLAVFYPYPAEIAAWKAALAAGFLLTGSIVTIRLRASMPYLAVGWFWFLGTLVPVIGFVQAGTQARADRYMYVPMVGLLIAIAWSMANLAQRRPATKLPIALAAAAAGVAYAAVTTVQLQYWRSSESLFAHALAVTHRNYVAEHNLGLAIAADPQRLQEAIGHYNAALAIQPNSVEAHSDLGNALATTGQLQAAATQLKAAVGLVPDAAIPHNNLGNVYFRMGMLDRAAAQYKAALTIKPDYAEAHNNLGAVLATSGHMQAAMEQFKQALRIDPDYAQARTNLQLASKPDASEP